MLRSGKIRGPRSCSAAARCTGLSVVDLAKKLAWDQGAWRIFPDHEAQLEWSEQVEASGNEMGRS